MKVNQRPVPSGTLNVLAKVVLPSHLESVQFELDSAVVSV